MMSEQQFPWTLRVVQPLPGQFGWVVINTGALTGRYDQRTSSLSRNIVSSTR
jgi:hypothetical protein